MRLLGVSSNPSYKILGYLDYLAMVSIHVPKYGLLDVRSRRELSFIFCLVIQLFVLQVKPLAVIWGKFPDLYSNKNTIMFDDIRRNFLLNPQNGLRIRAFREAHLNRDKDRELLYLAQYLKDIALLEDLSHLNHRHWEKYKTSSSKRR